MPEKSAAVSLPPRANTARPHWKPFMKAWKTTARATITSGASQSGGIPNGRKPGGSRPETSKKRPSVMMKASPRVMPMTPRVAMKGGRRTSTTSRALVTPASTPTRSPASTLGSSAHSFRT